MVKKLLDFQASISDVKQINPLFSTARARVLYTGKNRNMSIITKDAVIKALASLPNIPIVGEFSTENEDYKGHGGAIDLDSYRYIHTTKPYGVVPESATYEWESVRGQDGATREYLVINGLYLWTGRYEEAYSVIQNGKGQSMEIEVTDGKWIEEEESYQIDNFTFSALCILGDDVEPAFEDSNITAYSLDKDLFKKEFSLMMKDLKSSLSEEVKEVNTVLKKLLEKYSLTMEDVTAKGINLEEISEEEIEAKLIEVFEIEVKEELVVEEPIKEKSIEEELVTEPVVEELITEEPIAVEPVVELVVEPVVEPVAEPVVEEPVAEPEDKEDVDVLNARIQELEGLLGTANEELFTLREFKLDVEKSNHEEKAQKLFSDFQLTEEDVEDLDVHKFSVEEIEEKCYAILGRKLATKKKFSKEKQEGAIRLPLNSDNEDAPIEEYGGLFNKYNK